MRHDTSGATAAPDPAARVIAWLPAELLEDPQFIALVAQMVADHDPTNTAEAFALARLVENMWRLSETMRLSNADFAADTAALKVRASVERSLARAEVSWMRLLRFRAQEARAEAPKQARQSEASSPPSPHAARARQSPPEIAVPPARAHENVAHQRDAAVPSDSRHLNAQTAIPTQSEYRNARENDECAVSSQDQPETCIQHSPSKKPNDAQIEVVAAFIPPNKANRERDGHARKSEGRALTHALESG